MPQVTERVQIAIDTAKYWAKAIAKHGPIPAYVKNLRLQSEVLDMWSLDQVHERWL